MCWFLSIRNNDERSLLIGCLEISCSWLYYLIEVFDLTNAEQNLSSERILLGIKPL